MRIDEIRDYMISKGYNNFEIEIVYNHVKSNSLVEISEHDIWLVLLDI